MSQVDCIECRMKKLTKDCIKCKELIDGNYLVKETKEKFEVELCKLDTQEVFSGSIELVSPIGLALRSEVSTGKYKIKLLDNLELIISLINGKGKPPYQGFDIISVIRNGIESPKLSKESFEILSQSAEHMIDQLTEHLTPVAKNIIRDKLREEVEKSRLLDAFEVGEVLKYEKKKMKSLSVKNKITLSDNYLKEFMEEALRNSNYKRETVIDQEGKRVYDVHALPTNYQAGGIIAVDVTDVIKEEQKNEERELEIYRDVIEAVTGGKLKLINETELKTEISSGQLIIKQEVNAPQDLIKIREKVRGFLLKLDFSSKDECHIILCLSEAMTNALKHVGAGEVLVRLVDDRVDLIVQDQGTGIDFSKLPKATLMKNYSDYPMFSLGNGFTLMLRFMDQLLLKTNSQGTTLILRKKIV